MSRINRRDFLKFVGAGGVGVGAGMLYGETTQKTVEYLIPQVVPPEEWSPGIATWYNTACGQCRAGCGISVRIREGRAKKIEGNPAHPVNQGRLCALGQSGLNALYNPDRVRAPMLRGPAGSFAETTWDAALDKVARRLAGVRENGGGVRVLSGGGRGHVRELTRNFAGLFGDGAYLEHDFTYPANLYAANALSFGTDVLPYYDIANTRYLLSFGADYLGTWISPVHHSLGYGALRQGAGRKRGRTVQVESRMSLSGASADEYVDVRPGGDALLALSMAHVIAADGNAGAGWTQALTAYAPARVAEQTGVPAKRIEALAKAFASHSPSLAIGGGAAAAGTNGVATLVAVNALNTVAGNIGRPGGVLFNPPPGIPGDDAHASFAQLSALIDAMHSGQIDVLIVDRTNPVFNLPAAAGFAEALGNVGLVVSLSSFIDDTTAHADIVLPTDTYLEAWGDTAPDAGVGFPVATVSQPAVGRVYNTRGPGDIVLALAQRLGDDAASAYPWPDTQTYLKERWQQIHAASGASGEFDAFWRAILEAGVFGEDSEGLTAAGRPMAPGVLAQITPAAEFDGDAAGFPFALQPYLTLTFGDGRGANLPWQQELPDPLTSIVYSSWVEINPVTAAGMNIKQGDVLRVTSPAGTLEAPAFLYQGIAPGVVAMPIGQGHTSYGRYAQRRGANPLSIVAPRTDDNSGELAWAATRVSIERTGRRHELVMTDGTAHTLDRPIFGDNSGGGDHS